MSVEVCRASSCRCSNSHDGVERDWARNILDDVGDEPLAIDVGLEISVLEDSAASQTRDLSDGCQVDVRIVEDEQVDGAAGIDAVLT